MNCPGCATAMTALALDGHLGTTVDLDLCATCQALWFDHLESVRLSPGGTLRLFRTISEGAPRSPSPLRQPLKCPRCRMHLTLAHDRQRNTPFQYWRCGRDHGRLITCFEFLREKDFIRPLSLEQLAELRANVQMINCSNCGAPIDLAHASACAHCGTPISMLDLKQIERMASQLRDDDRPSPAIDPMLPERLAREKREVEQLFETMRTHGAGASPLPFGLVEVGLRLVVSWFD